MLNVYFALFKNSSAGFPAFGAMVYWACTPFKQENTWLDYCNSTERLNHKPFIK